MSSNLSVRTTAVLKRASLTLKEAVKMSLQDLAKLPNSSLLCAHEVKSHATVEDDRPGWEFQCYGMEESALRRMVDKPCLGATITPPQMIAMSILSDVQELIANGQEFMGGTQKSPPVFETARQYINRAKWIINERLVDK